MSKFSSSILSIAKLCAKFGKKHGNGFGLALFGVLTFPGAIILFLFGNYILLLIFLIFIFSGLLIEFINLIVHEVKIQQNSHLGFDDAEKLDFLEFEEWISSKFRSNGYSVAWADKEKNCGINIIVNYKHDRTGFQIILNDITIGIKSVRKAVEGMKLFDCDEVWIVTNAPSFSRQAENLANENNIILLDREQTKIFFEERYIKDN